MLLAKKRKAGMHPLWALEKANKTLDRLTQSGLVCDVIKTEECRCRSGVEMVFLSRSSRVYLGTMTFGWEQASSPVTDQVALMMCKSALAAGINTLDSARIYRFELAIFFLDSVARVKSIADIAYSESLLQRSVAEQPKSPSQLLCRFYLMLIQLYLLPCVLFL